MPPVTAGADRWDRSDGGRASLPEPPARTAVATSVYHASFLMEPRGRGASGPRCADAVVAAVVSRRIHLRGAAPAPSARARAARPRAVAVAARVARPLEHDGRRPARPRAPRA